MRAGRTTLQAALPSSFAWAWTSIAPWFSSDRERPRHTAVRATRVPFSRIELESSIRPRPCRRGPFHVDCPAHPKPVDVHGLSKVRDAANPDRRADRRVILNLVGRTGVRVGQHHLTGGSKSAARRPRDSAGREQHEPGLGRLDATPPTTQHAPTPQIADDRQCLPTITEMSSRPLALYNVGRHHYRGQNRMVRWPRHPPFFLGENDS